MSVVSQVLANVTYDGKKKLVDYDRASVSIRKQVKDIVDGPQTPRRRPPIAKPSMEQNLKAGLPEIEVPKPVPTKELKASSMYEDFTLDEPKLVSKLKKKPTVAKKEEDIEKEIHKDNKLYLNELLEDAFIPNKHYDTRPFKELLNQKYHWKSKDFTNFLKKVTASGKPYKNSYGAEWDSAISESKLNQLKKVYNL